MDFFKLFFQETLYFFSPLVPLPTISRLTKNVYECIGICLYTYWFLLILTLCSPKVSTLWVFIALCVWFTELILQHFCVTWKLRQFHVSVSLYEIISYWSLWSNQDSWSCWCSLCALQFLTNQNDRWLIPVYEHYVSCEVTECSGMFSYIKVIRFWKSR
jgi:hypothetical protein